MAPPSSDPAPLAPLTPAQRRLAEAPEALAMVERLVARFVGRGCSASADALRGAGHEALVLSARRFDPRRGTAFDVFAYRRVRGAMTRLVSGESAVQTSASEGGYRFLETTRDDADGWSTTPEESAAALAAFSDGFAASFCLALVGRHTVDAARGPERATGKREKVARLKAAVRRALAEASENDRAMLTRVYYEGESIGEAGDALGILYGAARKVHAEAVKRLGARLQTAGINGPPSSTPPSA